MSPHAVLGEHAPDPMSLHDLEGRFLHTTPAFTDLTGYPPGFLVGRDAYELIHPDDVHEVQVGHATVVELGRATLGRFRLRRAGGAYTWVEATAAVVPRSASIAVTLRPSAHRSLDRAVAAERLARERLRELERDREAFLTAIAHRARQPLTAIVGYAEVLRTRDGALPDAVRRELTERMAASAERLADLVEQVTRADGLRHRTGIVGRVAVDLRALATRVATAWQSSATTVLVEVPPRTLLLADRELLTLALRALVANAVDHTPPGRRIWIRAQQHPDGPVIVVEDDGPGIADDAKERLFAAFSRGDLDDHDPGLGLGLHLVANIAEAHGGHAWVRDRRGGGASFHLLVPLVDPQVEGTPDATLGRGRERTAHLEGTPSGR